MAKKEIFTEEALKKLRSPEQLDAMFSVTNSLSWLGLVALGIIVLSVVLWSCFGALITKVDGVGMLVDSKGVVQIVSPNAGWVVAVSANPGKEVGEYDLLAVVQSQEYLTNVQQIKGKMEETQSEQDVKSQITNYSNNEVTQLVGGNIVSPCVGVIGEVNIKKGDYVTAGSVVCTVVNNTGNSDIKGVLYVSAMDGKKIQKGMTIQVVPSGYSSTDDGQLLGIVRNVSRYPVSGDAIKAKMGNTAVTEFVLGRLNNSVVAVDFDLVKDNGNTSGYLWTVKRDSGKVLTSGSMITGFVVTSRKPPIEKVFYKISNWLRTR
ncbi:MAG: HlyD family efflux transporter periplasmic adaptor subunit [Phascolarctobacterium sp.]|nr:HlyD family efflux transporter periplasmic adaptor subunit [Candidatus Phascolarctobacterium caballi]